MIVAMIKAFTSVATRFWQVAITIQTKTHHNKSNWFAHNQVS